MRTLQPQDFASILGIFDPWAIKDIEISQEKEQILFILEKKKDKKEFFLFSKSAENDHLKTMKWHHIKLGQFKSAIQLSLPINDFLELDANGPSFVGKSSNAITNELSDSIQLFHQKGLDTDMIQSLLGTPMALIEQAINALASEQHQKTMASNLPLIGNPVWREVLTDKKRITTKLLPLKLLLSSLKLEISKKPDDPDIVLQSVSELRTFFVKNANQLKSEYIQIGAQISPVQKKVQSKQKFVLPALKSLAWQHILTGKVQLDSAHMGLKFNLAQQRKLYKLASNHEQRSEVIKNLALFIKANARALIPVLKQLTELSNQYKTIQGSILPPPEHDVWKQLLIDDKLLPSEKINYRLLLSRLKMTYQKNQDTSTIEELYQFFDKNSGVMTEEIEAIKQLASGQ